jgi:hypothetical protein
MHILINQFFSIFLYILPVVIVIAFFKSPYFKGKLGEFLVNIAAYFALDKNQYHILKNITINDHNATTQIDHIIVSNYGIFVIETKNMKGWIFGDQNQKIWTQKIYRYTNKFQNPLHQNY